MTPTLRKLREQINEQARARNRQRMPAVAALMDEFAQQFPGVKLLYAEETVDGELRSVGKKSEEGHAFAIPANYYPCQTVAEIVKKDKKK